MRHSIAAIGLFCLAACTPPTQPDERDGPAAGASATRAATPATPPAAVPTAKVRNDHAAAAWKAQDACSLLDKRTVGAALGTEITRSTLANNAPGTVPGETPAASSVCLFSLSDGQRVEFGTIRKLGSDISAEEIAHEREMASDVAGSVEDVQGVGRSAFWAPGVHRLDVFLGSGRRFYLTMPADMGAKDPKALALGLATRIE